MVASLRAVDWTVWHGEVVLKVLYAGANLELLFESGLVVLYSLVFESWWTLFVWVEMFSTSFYSKARPP